MLDDCITSIMAYQWKDKVIFITGAATGIGAVVVRKLVEFENVKNVTVLDISEEGVALEMELNSKFGTGKVTFIKGDVTKEDKVDAVFKSIVDKFGYLDVLINNAGVMNDGYEAYKKMVEINVTSVYTCTLKALEIMRKDEGGRGGTIVNIGSIANLFQHHSAPMYFGTKSAVLQFTLCLSLDDYYSRTSVRLLTVCFGATATPLLTVKKIGHFDKVINKQMQNILDGFYMQTVDSAAIGLIDACKNGENGSTWLVIKDKPVKNITEAVTKAYNILAETMN